MARGRNTALKWADLPTEAGGRGRQPAVPRGWGDVRWEARVAPCYRLGWRRATAVSAVSESSASGWGRPCVAVAVVHGTTSAQGRNEHGGESTRSGPGFKPFGAEADVQEFQAESIRRVVLPSLQSPERQGAPSIGFLRDWPRFIIVECQADAVVKVVTSKLVLVGVVSLQVLFGGISSAIPKLRCCKHRDQLRD